MRRPRLILIALATFAALVVGGLLVTGGSDSEEPESPAAFPARTVSAGEVTVKVQPHHADATGAEIEVTLDTHTVELAMDLVSAAELTVGDAKWPATAWEGDGPAGHHRAGTLRFESAGAPAGTVQLVLDGFDEPVTARWTLDG